ncbi:MAG: D-alanyl-D-alanine carboxypeptidase/D-alanyl-D-alanine-endopeptidase [Acidobacteria bacterium]|nr:D-alanyl-D-alanine carboxypeptidase/D-alanyl-D-alanine-endopeptidase [Acidobacteriota bacterium]MBI3422327.1 D-alanyl-D-alanine carboxypeptidase/D-alanyl-D-alanine-endopeptidase [Acidobacteriota bacterium]
MTKQQHPRCILWLLCLTLTTAQVWAQQAVNATAPAAPKPATLAELQTQIAALLDQPKFAAMRWGARIQTIDTQTAGGKVLFERDAEKSFTPASNMKLYTTTAALDAFGPKFKIKTSVYAAKPVSKLGVLNGDLILYGRGDPNLSARFDAENPQKYGDFYAAEKIAAIEQLADQIKARGIKVITGNIVGDDSYFAGDKLGVGWEWDDLQFYYGAEVSALTVNDNVITYVVTPGRRVGDAPTIATKPPTKFPVIINRATTSANGTTHIGVYRQLDTNVVEFFGSIPRGAKDFEVEIAVHEPASFAATLLKEALQRRGIRLTGRVLHWDAAARVTNPFDETKLTELASVQSQPLSTLLKVINKPSQNLHTELLLRQLGGPHGVYELDQYGKPKPTLDRAVEARKQFLQKAGVELTGLSLRDGSGLARSDLVTPRATARLLEFMMTHPHFTVFRESLPVAGFDGTLERRMKTTPAEGNVRAKTGSLTYVNALSGYLTTARGQVLIFSFYGNNYTNGGREVTGVMDQICNLLVGFESEL